MGPICQSCLPTDETVSAERGIIKQEWKLKVETKKSNKEEAIHILLASTTKTSPVFDQNYHGALN